MNKANITFEQLKQFNEVARTYVKMNEGNSKLKYWLVRAIDKIKTHLNNYNEAVDDLRVDYANEKDGKLDVTNDGKYQYTKDAFKKLKKDIAELNKAWDVKVIEVEKYKVSSIPEEMEPVDAHYLSIMIDFPEKELKELLGEGELKEKKEPEIMELVK